MDLESLSKLIEEELEGAMRYAKMAVELKPMTEAWSKKLMDMSTEEQKHANYLYSMFNEYCSKMAESLVDLPNYAKEIRSNTVDQYTKCMVKIKTIQEMYKS